MNRGLKILSILYLLIISTNLFADDIETIFYKHIDKLENEPVICTYRDSRGFLWVGTFMGIFKSDGTEYHFLTHDPNNKNSIGAPHIFSFFEDSKNRLWIGTQRGLDQFDYETNTFSRHFPDEEVFDWTYIEVRDITEDEEGNLWIATYNHQGLIKYNPHTKEDTTFWLPDYGEHRLNSVEYYQGNIWIGSEQGGLFKFNTKTYESYNILRNNDYQAPLTINDVKISNNIVWLGTWSNGLISYDIASEKIEYHTPIGTNKAIKPLNNVRQMALDGDDIWFAVYEGGFKKFDTKSQEVNSLVNIHDHNNKSRNHVAWNIELDRENILWLSTYDAGLMKVYGKSLSNKYFHYEQNEEKIQLLQINKAIEDKYKNIWVATRTQGLIKFGEYNTIGSKINLGNPKLGVITIIQDKLERIWASTTEGIFMIDPESKKVIVNLSHKNDLFNNVIKTPSMMYCDRDGDIWLAAWQTGLIHIPFNQMKKDISNWEVNIYRPSENVDGAIMNNNISNVYHSSLDTIYVSGAYFIQRFNKQSKKFEFVSWFDGSNMTEDCNKNVWISSNTTGIIEYKTNKDEFRFLGKDFPGKSNGLGIFSDSCSVWVTRHKDLLRVNSKTGNVNYYNQISGLKNMVHSNSCFLTSSGKIFIGGDEGCYLFDPNIKPHKEYDVDLSHLFIYNKIVNVNDTIKNKVVLKKSIKNSPQITIPAGTKSFSLELTSVNFINPEDAIFAYQMEGYDTTWHLIEYPNRTALFNNLNGGNYTLKYALYDPFGNWKENSKEISIKVLTPLYKTLWFRIIVVIIIIGLVILFFAIRQHRLNAINKELERLVLERTVELQQSNEELKTQTEQLNIANTHLIEKQEYISEQNEEIKQQKNELQRNNKLLTEMNLTKDKFFSIIAHDLKSPLGSLMGLLDMINEGYDSFSEDQLKNMIKQSFNSSETVYKLVENLLYWARTISGNVEFNPKVVDINKIISNNIKIAFLNSREKNISVNHLDADVELKCKIDTDMINFVVRNLISNAIKFTHIDGQVNVKAEIQNNSLLFQVKDNGIGIPADKIDAIFRISTKVTTLGTNNEKGTGLGLVLCKDFVEKHCGKIWIDSEVNMGSTFYFSIPV